MAKKARVGNSFKQQYSNYKVKSSWNKNAIKNLERHIKKYPEDEVAKEALKNRNENKTPYSRNRKSYGHICKVQKYIKFNLVKGLVPLSAEEQMLALGFTKGKRRDRRAKKITKQSA